MLPQNINAVLQYPLIVALCCICYGPAIPGSTFVFDDLVAIVRNDDVINTERSLYTTMGLILKHDFWGFNITDPTSHKSYRPLVTLTYNLEYRLFAGSIYRLPEIMKWNNLLLHCFGCCLLFSVLKSMLRQIKGRVLYIATILFAIHPIHTEAVSGIVGRAELMCLIFYLSAVKLYCQLCSSRNRSNVFRYGLLCTFTSSALLSKETGITVLPLCILYELIICEKILFHRPLKFLNRAKFLLLVKLLSMVSFTIFLFVARLAVIDYTSPTFKPMDNPVASADSLQTRILSQQYLYVLNFWLLLCSDWLSFDWSFHSIALIHSLLDVRIMAIIVLYLFTILVFVKGHRTAQMAYLWMIIPFLPASGLIKLGFVIAERTLYIPSIGFCILVSMGWDHLSGYFFILKKYGIYILYAMCAIFVLRTSYRAQEWINENVLFNSALPICPNNAKVYYNIGRLSSYHSDADRALNYYLYAIELYPDYDAALMNLGNLYRGKNQLDLAEKYIEKSIQITEEFPAAWMNLGIIKATKGLHDDALKCYSKALKYRKRYANCYYNLGNLYLEMNNTQLALQSWTQSLNINAKHSPSWVNILTLLDNEGKHPDVIMLSAKALDILQMDPAIIFLRANAMGKLNRYAEAEALYKEAIQLRPNHAMYYVNLGVLYHRWNRKELAAKSYQTALAINPNLNNVRKYLRMLKEIQTTS